MSYYWFNREKLLKNAWDKHRNKGEKQKTAKYYAVNQEVLRKDARNKYRNLSEKEKNKKRKYQRERYHMNTDLNEKLKQYQRNYHASNKKKKICFYCIKMSEQTLKFGDIVVNKIEFHSSKQAIALNLVNRNKIVVSDKFKHSDDAFKYFIGSYHDDDDDDVIRLCVLFYLK